MTHSPVDHQLDEKHNNATRYFFLTMGVFMSTYCLARVCFNQHIGENASSSTEGELTDEETLTIELNSTSDCTESLI